MIPAASKFNTLFIAYIVWVLILIPRGIWFIYTGDMKQNADSETFKYFVIMMIAVTIVTQGVGIALAWFTQKGNVWAKWLFIFFCIYFSVDSLLGTLQITEMYKQINQFGWFRGPVSFVIWLLLAGIAWSTSSNKSFKPTPKSGAV